MTITNEDIEKKVAELGVRYGSPCHGHGDCTFEVEHAAREMAEHMLGRMAENPCTPRVAEISAECRRFLKYNGGNVPVEDVFLYAAMWADTHRKEVSDGK